jgi:hypothetical protein
LWLKLEPKLLECARSLEAERLVVVGVVVVVIVSESGIECVYTHSPQGGNESRW